MKNRARISFSTLFPLLTAVVMVAFAATSYGQSDKTIDKVIAVVGEEVVLLSELEDQANQMRAAGTPVTEVGKCAILEELLYQKLLLNQARLDSVEVSEEQIQTELDRRLSVFIRQLGSEEALEKFYEKSIVQIKEEFHDLIRDQLLIQTMQGEISDAGKISPAEVREFYNAIPKDSLPYINSEVELAQIVRKPPITEAEKQRVIDQLNGFRDRILKGEGFGTLAYLYSEDPGSARQNGDLGFVSKGQLVPEFARVAFSISKGQVSEIVETSFGFHIMQLIERRGEEVRVRHILVKPKVGANDLVNAGTYLDSIRNIIETTDSIDFARAAALYSSDKETKENGGRMINPRTGATRFEIEELSQLDPTLFFVVDKLEPGQVSEPALAQMPDGTQAYRMIKLISRTEPHRANLKDDYQRIQEVASIDKQNRGISKWINKKAARTYIRIDDEYKNCKFEHEWLSPQ